MIVRRTTLVPGGHRLGYLGGGRLNSKGAQTKRRAADQQRCLQMEEMGGSEASRYRAPRGGDIKAISCPPEHFVPERVEFLEHVCIRNNKVAAVGEYREDGAKD